MYLVPKCVEVSAETSLKPLTVHETLSAVMQSPTD